MPIHSYILRPVPCLFLVSLCAHLFASNSAHTSLIFARFSLAASLFLAVRSSRCARKHMLTAYFASVQFPVTFQRKPRAWHSSSAATTSAQSRRCEYGSRGCYKEALESGASVLFCTSSVWRWGCIVIARNSMYHSEKVGELCDTFVRIATWWRELEVDALSPTNREVTNLDSPSARTSTISA
jgi:hypothetical protein